MHAFHIKILNKELQTKKQQQKRTTINYRPTTATITWLTSISKSVCLCDVVWSNGQQGSSWPSKWWSDQIDFDRPRFVFEIEVGDFPVGVNRWSVRVCRLCKASLTSGQHCQGSLLSIPCNYIMQLWYCSCVIIQIKMLNRRFS